MSKIFDGRGFEDSTDWYTRYFYYIGSMEKFTGSGENAGYCGAYFGNGHGLLHDHTDGSGYGLDSRLIYDGLPIEIIQYWK